MSKYAINNQIIERTDPGFDAAVKLAYQKKNRPKCLCTTPGVPMYIACIGDDKYIVKRMPHSGQKHHPECQVFESPPELSGRGALDQKAITENTETGITSLKLDFALTKHTNARTVTPGESKEPSEAKADTEKLTLRSLLHYLYEEASLNKWYPNMLNKRNWSVIQKHLKLATLNKNASRKSLADTLYIPEPYNPDQKYAIQKRRRQYLDKFKRQGSRQPIGLIIGEVKAIEPARYGYKMLIKHMPETPVYLAEDLHKRMQKNFSKEFAFFQEGEGVHLMVTCAFLLSDSGAPTAERVTFMILNRQWMPFENRTDLDFIDQLIDKKRSFIKGLRYKLTASDVIATAVLTDTKEKPTAVYMVPPDADEHYYEELNSVIANSEFKSHVIDHNKQVETELV